MISTSQSFELKPRPPWWGWPEGKKCDHQGVRHRDVISSDGWGMPYNKVKTICERCGTVLKVRPYSGN
jgi:hypothetical protein